MSNDLIVEFKNVSKKIKKKTLIDDLSFDIKKGEILGLLGPNGAGKTTTIRMLVGLINISEGDILINGKSIQKDFKEAIKYVGGIVENPELYSYLSGYDNLIHYSRMTGRVDKDRINEVIKMMDLEEAKNDKVKNYSLGMRQRLGLAQALLHKPSLLILDEPTNGLDPAGIREMRDYLRELTKQGISILVSSHLLSEMELMCDRIVIIKKGKLIKTQNVKETKVEGSSIRYIIDKNDIKKAKLIFNKILPKKELLVEENSIQLTIQQHNIPKASLILLQKGVKVYGIETINQSLEDKFLEITGGEE